MSNPASVECCARLTPIPHFWISAKCGQSQNTYSDISCAQMCRSLNEHCQCKNWQFPVREGASNCPQPSEHEGLTAPPTPADRSGTTHPFGSTPMAMKRSGLT